MVETARPGFWHRIAPALTLVFVSPMIAEVLPGATRMSAIFVLPIEMGFWGCGALLVRAAVRHWRLGWRNMLLLALAVSLAEELLVQQTSLAPLVTQIVKGAPYARDFGVNWLYLLWAAGYESVLVVFLPVMLTELIFRDRREQSWVSPAGLAVSLLSMAAATFLAWFSWTQYARTNVFRMPPYTPPSAYLAVSAAAILLMIFIALGPFRKLLARPPRPLTPPWPWLLGLGCAVVAVLWQGLVILAFRGLPQVPAPAAAAGGTVIALAALYLFPRWAARWRDAHRFAVVSGGLFGAMAAGFLGLGPSAGIDFYGKAVLDAAAVVLLITLAFRLRRQVKT